MLSSKVEGMERNTPILVSLPELAKVLNLPERWIKAEADSGRLPHLKIGRRYRFNLVAVTNALAERAANGGKASVL